MTWGPPVIKFIHICMGKILPESVWLKICWWKKVIDQTCFWQKTFKENKICLNKIKIFAE